MASCPRCAADLAEGYGSVCPTCGFVVRIPGVMKLALTLLAAGFAVAVVWTVQADTLFGWIWGFLNAILVQPLGLRPAPFELTGGLKALYNFVFGTPSELPWGGLLLIAAGIVLGFAGGVLLRRAEARGAPSA